MQCEAVPGLGPAKISSLGSLLGPEPCPLQMSARKAVCTHSLHILSSELLFLPRSLSLATLAVWVRVALWHIYLSDWTLWRFGLCRFPFSPKLSMEPSLINKWIDFWSNKSSHGFLLCPRLQALGWLTQDYPGLTHPFWDFEKWLFLALCEFRLIMETITGILIFPYWF